MVNGDNEATFPLIREYLGQVFPASVWVFSSQYRCCFFFAFLLWLMGFDALIGCFFSRLKLFKALQLAGSLKQYKHMRLLGVKGRMRSKKGGGVKELIGLIPRQTSSLLAQQPVESMSARTPPSDSLN